MNTLQDWKVTAAQVVILGGIGSIIAMVRLYFRKKNNPQNDKPKNP
jgi:hypothetical protein